VHVENAARSRFRYHQRMTGRAGHDVQKSQRVRVFIDAVARDFAAKDLRAGILIVVCGHDSNRR
jgi:hypothetical protein